MIFSFFINYSEEEVQVKYFSIKKFCSLCIIANIMQFVYRRKNVVSSKKNYLVAVYECMEGYVLKDPMADRMFCSKRNWLGMMPECIKEEGKLERNSSCSEKRKDIHIIIFFPLYILYLYRNFFFSINF